MAKDRVTYLSYEGLSEPELPFKAHVSMTADYEGRAVTLTDGFTAGYGSLGDFLLGQVVKYESDGNCTVKTHGALVLPGVSGSLPSYGDVVVVNGAGRVITATSAHAGYEVRKNVVLGVDPTNLKVVVLV